MKRIYSLFCISLGMMAPLSADAQADINMLDQAIQVLEERDKVLRARARYQSSEAERLLFEDWIDYQEHIKAMEKAEQEAKLVEMKIDALKKQRAELQATIH